MLVPNVTCQIQINYTKFIPSYSKWLCFSMSRTTMIFSGVGIPGHYSNIKNKMPKRNIPNLSENYTLWILMRQNFILVVGSYSTYWQTRKLVKIFDHIWHKHLSVFPWDVLHQNHSSASQVTVSIRDWSKTSKHRPMTDTQTVHKQQDWCSTVLPNLST